MLNDERCKVYICTYVKWLEAVRLQLMSPLQI